VIDLDKITEDLSRARALADLSIDASVDMSHAETEFLTLAITGLGAFRRLDNLRRRHVPLPFLLGFEAGMPGETISQVLPESIEVPAVTDALYLQVEWNGRMTTFCGIYPFGCGTDARLGTARLKVFYLLLKFVDLTEWGPAKRQEIKDLGTRVAVEVGVRKTGSTWYY
jgi:hypothetical protein